MPRITGWLAVFTLTLVHALPAQDRRATASADALQVRMELASVLLQSKRYLEAAREYRNILARRPHHFPARLGLARALAWSRQHRAAETELRWLRAQQPRHHDVQVLLRSVRQSLEPGSREAAVWLAEEPQYTPYRRALARALMREGNARDAVPHYARLVALDLSTPLVVEAARAYLAARQYEPCVALLDRVLARRPADGALLLTRAQVNYARRDLRAAETDALASLRMTPTPDAYLLLGDLQRRRGDYDRARTVYDYARRLSPTSADVRAAHAQLLRDERPVLAFIPAVSLGHGWRMRSTAISDNAGVAYATAGARRELEIGGGTSANVDVELRHIQEQSSVIDGQITGAALVAGLAQELGRGSWIMQLQGRGGVVHHAEVPMFTGVVSAAAWYGPWALSLEYAQRPAYPTLLTAAAIADPDEAALRESSMAAAAGGPLGEVDFALSMRRSVFSDDNQRITAQILTRYPITHNLALLGTAAGAWFTDRSDLYWSPQSYLAGGAGFELARRKPLGLSVAARLLAGPARSVEQEEHMSLQFSAGADFGYRSLTRDVGMVLTYGTGRAGGYSRIEAGVYASLLR